MLISNTNNKSLLPFRGNTFSNVYCLLQQTYPNSTKGAHCSFFLAKMVAQMCHITCTLPVLCKMKIDILISIVQD